MKKIAIMLAVIAIKFSVSAQYINDTAGWCPPGATWVYRMSQQVYNGFEIHTYVGDTAINGDTVKKILVRHDDFYQGLDTRMRGATRSDFYKMIGDSLFYYNQGTFELLWTYSDTAGSAFIYEPSASFNVYGDTDLAVRDTNHILSLGSDTFGNLIFPHQRRNLLKRWSIGDVIVGIGGMLSPYPSSFHRFNLGYRGLVCYYDSIRGFVYHNSSEIGSWDCYGLATSITEVKTVSEPFIVSPNPFSNVIRILNIKERGDVRVYDLIGNLLFEKQNFDGEQIDLSGLQQGLYIITFKTRTNFLTQRIEKL
ncbi:MAG: T9SS type A sorting domain-containing protein [Chitinophagales bacterium]